MHVSELFHRLVTHLEKFEMADFTKLNADIAALTSALADLTTKVDALLAKAPPVDEQPAVDAAAATVEQQAAAVAALAAKL